MAYAVKYLFRWESVNGTTREIRVLKDGYSGSVIQRRLGRAPVLKKQHNGAVHGTSLEFYAECAVGGEFAEFYTSDPKAYRVDLYSGNTPLWQGYITPELYSEPDIAPPYDVQVIATDGIGELKLYDFTPQGLVTLRSMLTYLLGYTGLATDVYLISSIKPGGTGAAGLMLAKSINLDYMEGKTCYEVLAYILDTLHATITWWKGAWILARETNVKFSSGKVQCFNANGNSTTLPGSVVTLGKMYANDAWPVGQLTSKIDPAKNSVRIQAPWHPVTALVNSDMTFDNGWTKAGGASYDSTNKGYHLPAASLEALPRIYQDITLSALKNPMTLTGKFTGVSADLSLSTLFTAAVGYYVTYEVGETTYHLERSDEGLVWKEGAMPNILNYGNSIYTTLKTFDEDEVGAQEVSIEIPPFILDDMFPGGTLIVYVFGSCVRVYSTALDVVISKGYQDNLYLDNGARGEGDEVEIAIGRETRAIFAYYAFLQGVLLDNGSLIYSFKDDYITANDLDFMSFIARDYARSYALPRLEQTGTVSLESAVTFPPLVFTKGAVDYWLEGYSWNMLDDELDISARSLPTATITVDSEVIGEVGSTTSSGASSSGGSGGGGGSIPSTSYDEFFASLQSQIDSVSSRNSFDELLATVLNTDILTAQSIYGAVLEVTGGAAIGGAASVGGLLTVGSIKLAAGTPTLTWDSTNSAWHLPGNFYVDGWISAGGVGSGGGGGGGGTTVSWGTATSNYTPLMVGSDTRNLSVYGHKHDTSDINDFSAAVAALIAGSDLATTVSTLNTTVSGHTTSIKTLNGYFTNGVLGVTHGGTDFSSYTTGDMLYASSVNTLAKLAGNSTTTKKFLTMTSRTPSWGSIDANDLPDLYWANIRVSDTSSTETVPHVGGLNTRGIDFVKGTQRTTKSFIEVYDTNSVFDLEDANAAFLLQFGDSNGLRINGETYGVHINDAYNNGVLINTPKLLLSTLLTFTAEQSDSGNTFDKGLEYSTTNHAWHLKGNLYVDGFISAGGLSSGGGGGESVVSWTTDIGTDTANVIGLQVGSESHFFYTKPWGDALDLRVHDLEAGSALSITTIGDGNAVTDVSKSGTVITVTKGATFLTAASLDGAEAALASLQSQVDSVSARNSYDELSATVFNADIVTATTAYIESIVGSLTGNAATATKLAASKTINGKAFDGSANIVTAYWGAERTITIKDNDGTNYRQNPNIDGSANFDLILPSTIKATLTGNATTATTLQTARSINGTSFNGSADITTAKWGTARTITVKDYTSTNSNANANIDGSANFNLILPESLKVKNLAATGALSVAGVATMSGTLDVTGAVSLSSSLTVAGNSTLQGNLTVNGNTTLGNNAQSDTLNVNSITTIAGTVTTRSTLDVNLAANQTVPSSAAAKKLRVWGPSYFQGAITLSNGNKSVVLSISQDGYLEVDGDMYATGFISAGGVN